MARVLSGIKPTGGLTLGNYIGALRNFSSYQDANDLYIFIADLHALTLPIDPDYLRQNIYDLVAFYLAAGLDPKKCILFRQSDIAEVGMLNSILINYIYMGELSRMTQYKAKVQELNGKEIGCGLFAYPVLMAADLFMYDTEICPVGEDQVQHVELARDIAKRFNAHYAKNGEEILKTPKAQIGKVGKRIMSLQDPLKKMSKSDERGSKGVIYLKDDPKAIAKKIMSAVTDMETVVRYDPELKPGVSNLLTIYSAVKDLTIEEAESHFNGVNYGTFKKEVADAVLEELVPFQERFYAYRNDMSMLNQLLEDGALKARKIASEVLTRVKTCVGLL